MIFEKTLLPLALMSVMTISGCASAASLQDATSSQANQTAHLLNGRLEYLATNQKVQDAFQTIRNLDAKNIERLIALTEIPAPPFQEATRGEDLAKRLKALGLSNISTDEVGNVIARRPGITGTRTLAIGAHIDTVFPPETDVTVKKNENIYTAPGIGDNTRGLVVLLSLVEAMEKHDIQTNDDVLFIGTVGEEGLGDLRGMRHLFREDGPKIDNFIAIDGGAGNRLIVKAVGSNRYRVTFNGPGGHSYGAFGRGHPHQALGEAITNFTKAATPITEGGPKATFSVGRIGGGTSINSIPFSSWMEVDMRSVDPNKLTKLDAAFQKSVQDALKAENARRSKSDAVSVDIKSVGKRPAGQTNEDASLIANASAALNMVGLTPNLTASSTDSNIPMSLGIPAITMSRGGKTRNAHAPNESWENIDSHIAIQALLLAVLAEAGIE